MRKEIRQRLAKEYRYAVTKMQEIPDPAKKLFYFSVFFSEAQRDLNWEWDRDLVLIFTVTQNVHLQITTAMQNPATAVLPIAWPTVFEKLAGKASDLTAFYEKAETAESKQEMYHVLGQLAEIAFVVQGNGSYLFEKGIIKL
jgi:hypothetical protein